MSEDNGEVYPEEFYTNKHQKHIACNYGYKLVCVDDKFSKPFKTYLGEDAVYNFIIVQGIRPKILQNLKQIGIKINLVWLEA